MKVHSLSIRNFRRLEDVSVSLEDRETVFVGPNNSGKTSAAAVIAHFLDQRSFHVHDFSVRRIAEIDAFGDSEEPGELPKIELDIWLEVDPDRIEFGRAFALIPNLSEDFEQLGIRLSYQPDDSARTRAEYLEAYPRSVDSELRKALSEFLGEEGVLGSHFGIKYFSLERSAADTVATPLESKSGKSLLHNMVRVDFVDAQRNIDDQEGGRASKLSAAFADFYEDNLELAEVAADARKVIDSNNRSLTEHYERQFQELMEVIKGLGVPSVNDRVLKIVSALSAEAALKGSTDLLYVDEARNHRLPELYNGLGFKNLIYMAIQVKHFYSQWLRTAQNRPLCQLIVVEEPEVHLHAQVQQVFINNIWEVITASSQQVGESSVPQLIVTTHSTHVLDETDFMGVRYFRRCPLAGEIAREPGVLNATEIKSLRDFRPRLLDEELETEQEVTNFLSRYLRLTHCDLFFADAAILVEGSAEKLLIPAMIDRLKLRLRSSYLTILEVGGAYAHRFEDLLSFLCIPYLVVADLDSVEFAGKHPTCRADTPGALTSNATLKKFFGVNSVAQLMALTPDQKGRTSNTRYTTFQTDVRVDESSASVMMRPRTLEEAFLYENFDLVRDGSIAVGIDIPFRLQDAYEAIYQRVKSSNFKKTDFAMQMLFSASDWEVPAYIAEGLYWLDLRLHGPVGA